MTGEDYESDFEYDGEDIETGEDLESEGEDLEAAGEDLESSDVEWEGAGESDLEAESDYEAESLDESDLEAESDLEGESLDESLDEAAVSASARLRASQDRNRRAAFARQVAADRRLEARRAASTQKSITTQIKAIQPGPPPKVYSVGALQGTGVVTAVLPNGRRSRMRIIPTVAPISEVNRLRSVVMVNEKRQAVAAARNSKAIARLASAQAATVKRLTAQQVKSDQEISKRLVDTHNRLDTRITKELSGGAGVVGKHGKRMMRALRRQRTRSLWNNLLVASSAPFFAAYGERSDPFAKNNLILTGSLAGWMLGDEVIDYFGGKSPGLRGAADIWSYLAPIGNGATAYFLLNDKQHERFIADIATIATGTTVTVDLTKRIGSAAVDQFKKDTHTPVVSLVTGTGPVSAVVDNNGVLTITGKTNDKVAWIVDTQAASS